VKGLGEALHKPVYGVSNLEALLRYGTAETVVPFYDARRGDVYARLPDREEVVMPLDQVCAQVKEAVEWVSFEPVEGMAVTLAPKALAGAIGLLAEQRWLAGDRPDAAALDANYVRRTDAELNWRDASLSL
jgi:tRNA threonylcarbamoyladenosine biosynthesis protein TsaB